MYERGRTRLRVSAVVGLLAVALCLAGSISPAGARRGCRTRCRQLSGVGAEPPAPRRMALRQSTAHMGDGFVSVRLKCLRSHQACRGLILLRPRKRHSRRLARMHFRVPSRRTRRVEIRLTPGGSVYLERHERVRALLSARYPGGQVDAFRLTVIG